MAGSPAWCAPAAQRRRTAAINQWVKWGAGPRAGQSLVLAAKRALLQGRFAATREDVQALAAPVMRHRLLLSFAAEAERSVPTTWSPPCCRLCRSRVEPRVNAGTPLTLPPELRARLRAMLPAWPAAPVASASTPAAAAVPASNSPSTVPTNQAMSCARSTGSCARSDRFFVRESEREPDHGLAAA
jgi:hypothetical protein